MTDSQLRPTPISPATKRNLLGPEMRGRASCLGAVCFSEAKIKEREARGYYIACLNLENRILRLGHCTKMKEKENIESSVIILLHATPWDDNEVVFVCMTVSLRRIRKSCISIIPEDPLALLNATVTINGNQG